MATDKLKVWKTPTAHAKIKNIYAYTRKKWGRSQAHKYISMLEKTIKRVASGKVPIRKNPEFSTRFTYCIAKRHYIFFEHQKDKLIVVTIFHTAMSIKDQIAEEMLVIDHEINKIKD